MHEILTKNAEIHAPAPGRERWRRHGFDGAAGQDRLHRVGASFAEVGIRQSSPRLQAKLTVSQPQDSAEREADRVADAVLQAPANPMIGRKDDDHERKIDRAVEAGAVERDEDEVRVMRHAGGAPAQVTPALEAEIQSAHGAGAPLARETRAFFEPRLGVDLSGVRVSTGAAASRMARQLDARAFTVGNHITFGAGEYRPGSDEGKRLLAHELTHVIQQGAAGALPDGDASEP